MIFNYFPFRSIKFKKEESILKTHTQQKVNKYCENFRFKTNQFLKLSNF